MESPATDENTTMGVENHQVNEELLLKQITELVINQRLLSGKTNAEDRVVNFVHPEDLKVYSNFNMNSQWPKNLSEYSYFHETRYKRGGTRWPKAPYQFKVIMLPPFIAFVRSAYRGF